MLNLVDNICTYEKMYMWVQYNMKKKEERLYV